MLPASHARALSSALAAALVVLAPAAARAGVGEGEEEEGPAAPGASANAEVRTLWSDGDELLIAGGRSAVLLYDREGETLTREGVEIERFVDAAGTRAGGNFAVFVAADGRLVTWRGGKLEQQQVPLLEGDEIVAVTVDASGTIFVVGREKALYELWRKWRVYPFPTEMRPLAAETTPGGQVHIVGRDGLLVRFLDGEWDRPLIPGLSPASLRAPWQDAWYSAVTETLWVRVGRDRLLELEFGQQREIELEGEGEGEVQARGPETDEAEAEDPDTDPPEDTEDPAASEGDLSAAPRPRSLRVSGSVPAREHPIPIGPPSEGETPAGFTAITGVSSADGDRVVTSAGDRLWLWDHGRFVLIDDEVALVHDLVLDEGRDIAWLATRDGLEQVPLSAISEAEETPLSEEDRKVLERMRKREEWRMRQADAPEFFWMPTIHVDNGVVFPLGQDPQGPIAGYSLEIGAGAMLQPLYRERGPTLWVWPEVAYRFETHPTRGGHLFDLGVGVGFGGHIVNAFYRPRLVLGGIDQPSNDGPAVYGIRHGVALEALWGVLGLEFSHQYLGSNAGPLNDLRLGLSINLAPLIWAGILWATIPTGR